MLFFDQVHIYKKTGNPQLRLPIARHIYKAFLHEYSAQNLKIDSAIIQKVEKNLDDAVNSIS